MLNPDEAPYEYNSIGPYLNTKKLIKNNDIWKDELNYWKYVANPADHLVNPKMKEYNRLMKVNLLDEDDYFVYNKLFEFKLQKMDNLDLLSKKLKTKFKNKLMKNNNLSSSDNILLLQHVNRWNNNVGSNYPSCLMYFHFFDIHHFH